MNHIKTRAQCFTMQIETDRFKQSVTKEYKTISTKQQPRKCIKFAFCRKLKNKKEKTVGAKESVINGK